LTFGKFATYIAKILWLSVMYFIWSTHVWTNGLQSFLIILPVLLKNFNHMYTY
jgi:hypothetical protein